MIRTDNELLKNDNYALVDPVIDRIFQICGV